MFPRYELVAVSDLLGLMPREPWMVILGR